MVVQIDQESDAYGFANDDGVYDYTYEGNKASDLIGPDSSALSLDGRSLLVPDYGDLDDMSSLGANSKYTYRGDGNSPVRYIGDMRIVGKADKYETDPKDMTSLEKKLSGQDPTVQYGGYDTQTNNDLRPTNEGKVTDSSQSFEEKRFEEEEATKSNFIPQWITEAPLWLKLIIIASIALLLGALVLIALGAKLSSQKQNLIPSQENSFTNIPIGIPIDVGEPADSTSEFEEANDTEYIGMPAVTVTSSPATSPSFAPVGAVLPPVVGVILPIVDVTSILETSVLPPVEETSIPETSILPPVEETSIPETSILPPVEETSIPETSILPPVEETSIPETSILPPVEETSIPETSVLPPVEETSNPEAVVSTNATTSAPSTASPTVVRSPSPTQSPTMSTFNFFVMGGRFDAEDTKILDNGLKSLPTLNGNTMLVHLGDWNSPYSTSCVEDSFITNVDSYQKSSIPVYFVPGDNEYNDCPNPTEAIGLWNQYLLDFESKYWEDPSWDVIRQTPDYSENFAFLQSEVLFVGINLVGGIVHNQEEWDSRHEADLLWIDTTAAKYDGNYTTMVIFAHADPDIQINQNFFKEFYPMVERYDERVILFHRNLGIDTWNKESGYNDIANLDVVAVEGSKWPPMWVQIDLMSGTYTIDQSSWYDEYISTETLPFTP